MACFICVTCGSQHAESDLPPDRCLTCEDERQYIGHHGQQWTTIEALAEAHEVRLREEEPGLVSVELTPQFAIGQRAMLVLHSEGNVLWDALPLVDQASADAIADLGGIAAIAVSHPHFYGAFVEWSRAFGDVPVYLHDADAAHVRRPDPCVTFWAGDTYSLADGLTLVRTGGHFEGSTLLEWKAGAGGKGVLLTSDTVKVGLDRRSVSVMRSYPNLIPVGPAAVTRLIEALAPLTYDRLYGGWAGHHVLEDARARVVASLTRYLRQISR
jgi:glyoxylase-like metal-dependent hydrolase (beta-lactamase superfamily II)